MYSRDLINSVKQIAKSIYTELGVGLPFEIYEACINYELTKLHVLVEKDVIIPISYKDLHFDAGCVVDFRIDKQLIVGINRKHLDEVTYKQHIESYLKHSKCCHGLFINFAAKEIENCISIIEKKQAKIIVAPMSFSARYYENYVKK